MGARTRILLAALLAIRGVGGGVADVDRYARIIVAQDVLDLTPPLVFDAAAAAAAEP